MGLDKNPHHAESPQLAPEWMLLAFTRTFLGFVYDLLDDDAGLLDSLSDVVMSARSV
jgi:hypothetical protein